MPEKTYRINPVLPRYERVPVFKEGTWHPCGACGRTHWDAAYVQELADSYDPAGLYAATMNEDHFDWWGPALAVITAAYAEQDADGLLTLYVDVANVDPATAAQIDNGSWPARSIEWHDAEIIANYYHGADWEEHVEEYLFYGQHRRYLTGLGLLGQVLPAVAGLGQWPPQAPPVVVTDDAELELRINPEPLAARSRTAQRRLRLIDNKHSPKEDAPMADTAEATKTTTGEPVLQAARAETPAPEASADDEQQIRENEKLRQREQELTRAETQRKQQEMERLTAENSSLTERIAAMEEREAQARDREQQREVQQAARERELERERVVAELRASGHLVPANEAQFIAAFDALHGQQPTMQATSAGERISAEKAPLPLLLELIKAGRPQRSTQEIAAEAARTPQAGLAAGEHGWTGEPTAEDFAMAQTNRVSIKAHVKAKYGVDYAEPAGGEK